VSVPHGGALVLCIADAARAAILREEAATLPRLVASPRRINDLELLAVGALSPLRGFMSRDEYTGVLAEMRLPNGVIWSLPIGLDCAASEVPAVDGRLAVCDGAGRLRAVMTVTDRYDYDKAAEARNVYGTEDAAHPGVAAVYAQGDVLLGGPVEVLPHPSAAHALTPLQTRAEFARRGWRTVVGFQTRNPVHRAHEYIQKCALETVDGLLLHPIVGETKADDIPAEVRIRCYETLLEHYYPAKRVLFATLPAAMRYAGPREAIFHALMRKNYGCTHFIVGRDHAGVGNYYDTYAAQRLIASFPVAELGIVPLMFENSFFCRRCEGMASEKTCPHDVEHHVALSGTKVRAMLAAGEFPPPEFSRPEVARILIDAASAARSAESISV